MAAETTILVKVGGSVASAAVGFIADQVQKYISDSFQFEPDVKDKLKCLEEDLQTIQAVLCEADKRRIENPRLVDCLQDIKDATYDAEAVLDMFEYKILQEKVEGTADDENNIFKRCFTCANSTLINSQPAVSQWVSEIMQSRVTTSMPIESKMFGREKESAQLMKLLNQFSGDDGGASSSRNVHVLPVVGIGGVGKTTLVRDVYNNQVVKFDLKAWVCVSHNFDVKRLTKEIIESASISTPPDFHLHQNLDRIQQVLLHGLKDKRFLIVLDDIWNDDAGKWKLLQSVLNCGKKGSRVVVTTRSPTIADMMGTTETTFLEGLADEEFHIFFASCAFGEENPASYPGLKIVAEKIAKKLKGNPLAAKTVGALLNQKLNVEYWKEVLQNDLWQTDQQKDGIMQALRLSYEYLPSYLKQCFVYCSLFPKDYRYEKTKLVRMWIAHGFILPSGEQLLEKIGEAYVNELLSRSFILELDSDSYVIHDLLHDLAQSLSDGEIYIAQNDEAPKKKVRHISICSNNLSLLCNNDKLGNENLRSLVVFDCSVEKTLDVLSELKGIRVLVLHKFPRKLSLKFIQKMLHLRYLEMAAETTILLKLGGWVASTAVGFIADQVQHYINDHFQFQPCVKYKLKCLEQDLKKIQAVLEEADKRRIENSSLGDWLQDINDATYNEQDLKKKQAVLEEADKRRIENSRLGDWLQDIKDATYDAEDVLDMFEYKIIQEKVEGTADDENNIFKRCFTYADSTVKNFIVSGDVVKKLNEVVDKFKGIAADRDDIIKLIDKQPAGSQLKFDIMQSRETTSTPIEYYEVFGRQEEMTQLLKLLNQFSGDGGGSSSSRNFHVLPVVGIGGVGKTTLVQDVYNNQDVKFDLKAWVCVSDNFDVKWLTKEIIESASISKPHDFNSLENLDRIQQILQDGLKDKRFLIVLDDVWNENNTKWEQLQRVLNCGKDGSRVIVTTRNEKIAKMMGTKKAIHLEGLVEEEFWRFFIHCAFGDENPANYPGLEFVGKQIVEKLKGIPLAAKTVGALLKQKLNVEYWKEVLQNELWQTDQQKDGIMQALRLSYEYLPSHLKQCFVYCSLFPKDYEYSKTNLVRMWIAHGFILPNEQQLLEKIGEAYFNELLRRSFIDELIPNKYVIHDLLYDLAQSLSDGEIYIAENDEAHISSRKKVRHISICSNNLSLLCNDKLGNENVRSLVVFDCSVEKTLDVLSELKGLRVLVLHKFPVALSLKFIQKMLHLRYLELEISYDPWGDLSFNMPELVCKLYHLQVLRVGRNYIDSSCVLPNEINRLIKLRHLEGGKTKGIGSLTLLQELKFEVNQGEKGLDIGQIRDMSELRTLCLEGLETVKTKEQASQAMLGNKKHLKYLKLEWRVRWRVRWEEEILEGSQPHQNQNREEEEEEEVEEEEEEEVLEGSQPHQNQNREEEEEVEEEEEEEVLEGSQPHQNINCLSYLRGLWLCWKGKEDHHINLLHNEEDVLEGLQPHRNLEQLEIKGYGGGGTPSWWNANWASNLITLTLYDCSKWEFLPPLGHLPFLKTLRIKRMKAVKSIGSEFYASNSVGLSSKIIFPSLERLKIYDMPELKDWYKIEEEGGGGGFELFPRLKHFRIGGCPKLRGSIFHFPPSNFNQINVKEDLSFTFHFLISEDEYDTDEYDDTEESIIVNCASASIVPEWLPNHNLVFVERVIITAPGMRSCLELVEWIQHLTSLHSLCFSNCFKLESLPSNLISSLSTLRILNFKYCPKIKSLPEEGLPDSLQVLHVLDCYDLAKRCMNEYWQKMIAHIPTFTVDEVVVTEDNRKSLKTGWHDYSYAAEEED